MKAARLHAYNSPFVLEEVDHPRILDGEGLVLKVAGCGFCHSDIYVADGELQSSPPLKLPYILGHEIGGNVYEIGSNVEGFSERERVLLYGGWGCGICELCKSGVEQLCEDRRWVGITSRYQGGYAEFVYVPSFKYLLKVDVDPTGIAPLTDAGLTSYRAVKKVKGSLDPGSFAVVFGIGGLGSFALQYLKLLTATTVIAVDVAESRIDDASRLGADHVINSREQNLEEEVLRITRGKGAHAILDFVGSDSTCRTIPNIISIRGTYVGIGLAGGVANLPVRNLIRKEANITGNEWGNYNELREVYNLFRSGNLKITAKQRKLEEINETAGEMRKGLIEGRVVLVP